MAKVSKSSLLNPTVDILAQLQSVEDVISHSKCGHFELKCSKMRLAAWFCPGPFWNLERSSRQAALWSVEMGDRMRLGEAARKYRTEMWGGEMGNDGTKENKRGKGGRRGR